MKKFHLENHLERLFTILMNSEKLLERDSLKEQMHYLKTLIESTILSGASIFLEG